MSSHADNNGPSKLAQTAAEGFDHAINADDTEVAKKLLADFDALSSKIAAAQCK